MDENRVSGWDWDGDHLRDRSVRGYLLSVDKLIAIPNGWSVDRATKLEPDRSRSGGVRVLRPSFSIASLTRVGREPGGRVSISFRTKKAPAEQEEEVV